jgi:hypothetical protein
MKFEVGDLVVVSGFVWLITQKSKNCPLVLQNRDRIMQIYAYEIKRWMKLHNDSKHYPVIQ